MNFHCLGCRGKPGDGRKYFLRGEESKGGIRTFIQEKRQQYLERLGISHSPSSADVPLEQMRVCKTCRRSFYKEIAAQSSENSQLNNEPNVIELTIPRMVSNRRCVFGHQSEQLFRIPEAVRGKILVDHHLYVPSDARCCTKHLKKGEWTQLAPSELRSYSPTQIEDMVDLEDMVYLDQPEERQC
jgi:hypothetical protein